VNRLFVGDRESEAALSLNTFKVDLKKVGCQEKTEHVHFGEPDSRTYICIDNKKDVTIALIVAREQGCGLNGTKTRTAGICANMASALKPPFVSLTILMLSLRDDCVAEEERWITVGAIGEDAMLLVVHGWR